MPFQQLVSLHEVLVFQLLLQQLVLFLQMALLQLPHGCLSSYKTHVSTNKAKKNMCMHVCWLPTGVWKPNKKAKLDRQQHIPLNTVSQSSGCHSQNLHTWQAKEASLTSTSSTRWLKNKSTSQAVVSFMSVSGMKMRFETLESCTGYVR